MGWEPLHAWSPWQQTVQDLPCRRAARRTRGRRTAPCALQPALLHPLLQSSLMLCPGALLLHFRPRCKVHKGPAHSTLCSSVYTFAFLSHALPRRAAAALQAALQGAQGQLEAERQGARERAARQQRLQRQEGEWKRLEEQVGDLTPGCLVCPGPRQRCTAQSRQWQWQWHKDSSVPARSGVLAPGM